MHMLLLPWFDTLRSVLLQHLFERTDNNQVDLFSEQESLIQKALAVSASLLSILFCILAIYMFQAIDPKRLVFRHQLIAFLIFFDLLKAIVLLIFPARVMINSSSYASNQFCQVVGFFTATATEGADLAILAFAIHIFLLIFKPCLNVKVKDSSRVEGGLYKYRYFVYGLSFAIPLAMASFPYIGLGYMSFVCWCYLPQRPLWYRAALSWAPRYVIVIVIFSVYALIYIHVLREFRLLGGAFTQLHRQKTRGYKGDRGDRKPSFFSAVVFFLKDMKEYICPSFHTSVSGEGKTDTQLNSPGSRSNPESSSDEQKTVSPGDPRDLENNIGHAHFHSANLESFQKRQKSIEKQMKSIFIYPIAYVLIWLFPFILHCTQIEYEEKHGPVVWLNYLGAFMQPFIGFVDSAVFFYREQPWKYTIMRNFEKENESKLDLMLAPGSSLEEAESVTTSARYTKSSWALSMHVDLNQYSSWRQFMSKCRFPLMQLPSEENIAKFQAEYLKRKMIALRLAAAKSDAEHPSNMNDGPEEIVDLQAKHDFSHLLNGGNALGDVRLKFDSYSFGNQNGSIKPSLNSCTTPSRDRRLSLASISNKSAKSRRVSVFEGQDPIPEHASFVKGVSKHIIESMAKKVSVSEGGNEDEEIDLLDFLGRGPG